MRDPLLHLDDRHRSCRVINVSSSFNATKSPAKTRGASLIMALVFTLISSVLLGVIGTFALANLNKATIDSDYAAALNIAEAGINYELRWISADTSDPNRAHQAAPVTGQNGPFSGSISGVPGTFAVSVTQWDPDAPDGSGISPWYAPKDLLITSVGTVNGVIRVVRARSVRKSVFEEYVLYATDSGTFSGGGSSSTSTAIWGDLGTNGDVTFNGTLNTDIVVGDVSLNGGDAGSSDPGSNLIINQDPVEFPTIPEIADSMWTGGLSHLVTNNSNANMRKLSGSNNAMSNHTSITGITLAMLGLAEQTDPNAKSASTMRYVPSGTMNPMFVAAGFVASSRLVGDPNNSYPNDTSALDAATTGTRYVTMQISVVNGEVVYSTPPLEGVVGKKLLIIPPGDYYWGRVDLKGGDTGVIVLNHLGPVRIWVDTVTGFSQADALSVPIIFTSTNPSKFRLFYNKCQTLTMSGSSNFYGGFYSYKPGCSTNTPEVKFTGNSTVYGSVITNYFTVSGGTRVIFPNDSGSDPTDYSLWYGFKDRWRELTVPGTTGPVFRDGTDN